MSADAFAGRRRVPRPENEPNYSYAPGSRERADLKARLAIMAAETIEIPVIIGGREIRTGAVGQAVMPHKHAHVLANFHKASADHVRQAVDAALAARKEWSGWSFEDRAAVFLKAAELLTTTWRPTINAATMLGQSKTVFQAEIDAASELIDFWRFNTAFAQELLSEQPDSTHAVWNQMEYRPLEGLRLRHLAVQLHRHRRQPRGRPGADGQHRGLEAGRHRDAELATTSTSCSRPRACRRASSTSSPVTRSTSPTCCSITRTSPASTSPAAPRCSTACGSAWARTSGSIAATRGSSAKPAARTSSSSTRRPIRRKWRWRAVRGAFEFQGQKCSAASRMYVPKSRWHDIRDRMVAMMKDIRMGDVRDFRNFMGAVIDKKAFTKISGYIDDAKKNATIIQGGGYNGAEGYFIEPTLIEASDPAYRSMCEEIFGPVLSVYVYDDAKWSEMLSIVDRTSPYALTGAIFARDRAAVREAASALRNAAGNFYINDKPTGAVVGQQPFGGARASGTNDKAGSKMNLMRWVSARTVKETFAPPTDYRYPFMA